MSLVLLPFNPLAVPLGVELPVQIYAKYARDASPVLLLSSGSKVSHGSLAPVHSKRLPVLVSPADKRVLLELARTQLQTQLTDDQLSPFNKAALLIEVLRGTLEESFEAKETPAIVDAANATATEIAKYLPQLGLSIDDLHELMHHDGQPVTHAANIGIYACRLGHALGLERNDLAELTVGAMLADVGKLSLPDHLLRKTAKLTQADYATLQSHVTIGFRQLSSVPSVTRAQLLVAYQHHERSNGSGYPVGLPSDETHPWAQLVSIVDAFDAMTCRRPYRPAISVKNTQDIMRQDAKSQFQQEFFKCWESLMLAPTTPH